MRKRVHILFAILAIAIIGQIAWLIFVPSEPVYQGKRLTIWLRDYDVPVVSPGITSVILEHRRRADEAVRAIGTNAIPTLLRLLRAKDSPLKLKLIRLAQNQHFVTINSVPASCWNNMAANAFFALSHDADSALPALMDIYQQNISPESRQWTLWIIDDLSSPAKPIVASLLPQATDPNRDIRQRAVWNLGRIHREPEQVVPALMKALHDSDFCIRADAARGLGAFGPAAKQAIPALVESLKGSDPDDRTNAAKSLLAIDPEAAAKAGVK